MPAGPWVGAVGVVESIDYATCILTVLHCTPSSPLIAVDPLVVLYGVISVVRQAPDEAGQKGMKSAQCASRQGIILPVSQLVVERVTVALPAVAAVVHSCKLVHRKLSIECRMLLKCMKLPIRQPQLPAFFGIFPWKLLGVLFNDVDCPVNAIPEPAAHCFYVAGSCQSIN